MRTIRRSVPMDTFCLLKTCRQVEFPAAGFCHVAHVRTACDLPEATALHPLRCRLRPAAATPPDVLTSEKDAGSADRSGLWRSCPPLAGTAFALPPVSCRIGFQIGYALGAPRPTRLRLLRRITRLSRSLPSLPACVTTRLCR